MAGNLGRTRGYKRVMIKLHEQIALAALIVIGLHSALLLGDRWLRPGLSGILVPFTMGYRPLWTGLGILARRAGTRLELGWPRTGDRRAAVSTLHASAGAHPE